MQMYVTAQTMPNNYNLKLSTKVDFVLEHKNVATFHFPHRKVGKIMIDGVHSFFYKNMAK